MTSRYWDVLRMRIIGDNLYELDKLTPTESEFEEALKRNTKDGKLTPLSYRDSYFYQLLVSTSIDRVPYLGVFVPPVDFKDCAPQNRQIWHDYLYIQRLEERFLRNVENLSRLTLKEARSIVIPIECDETKQSMLDAGFCARHFKRLVNGLERLRWSGRLSSTLLLRVMRLG